MKRVKDSNFAGTRFPFSSEADPEGKGNKVQIKINGLFSDIKKIVSKLAMWCGILGDIDSGQTGQSGPDLQPFQESGDILILQLVSFIIFYNLTHGKRSGADKAHLAGQDVEYLGKFIQPHGAQDSAYPGDPMIVFNRLLESELPVGVRHHGSKFIYSETCPAFSPALLSVKKGAAVFQLNGQGNWKRHGHG